MTNRLLASIPLVIVMSAAVAAAALRAGTRRPASPEVLSTEPAPVTPTAEETQPQQAVTAVPQRAEPPGTCGRSDASVDQRQYVFHELHAEGCHPLCEVCTNQHR